MKPQKGESSQLKNAALKFKADNNNWIKINNSQVKKAKQCCWLKLLKVLEHCKTLLQHFLLALQHTFQLTWKCSKLYRDNNRESVLCTDTHRGHTRRCRKKSHVFFCLGIWGVWTCRTLLLSKESIPTNFHRWISLYNCAGKNLRTRALRNWITKCELLY